MIKIMGMSFLLIIFMVLFPFLRMRRRKGAITRDTVLRSVRETKWLRFGMLLLTVAFAGIFTFLYYREDNSKASVQITLNYAEASKGQNANGVRYNMSEIISDEVIERAIEKGALEDVTVSELKNCLRVYPLVDGNSYNEKEYHISTEFGVDFVKNKSTSHLDPYEVVNLIGYAYKDYYIDKYAADFRILNMDTEEDEDFDAIDYMDIRQRLSLQTSEIANYMYALAEENGTFTATNGETFLSIAGKCVNLQEVMIENSLEAYLLQNGVSKDSEEYVDRLSYDNKIYDFNYQRADANYEVCNDAVAFYEEEMTRIVLVPTWDADGQYYMGRTKVGVDELSVEAEGYSQQAAQYAEEIETNKSIIRAMTSSRTSGTDEYAEALIANIRQEIVQLADMALQAVQEYSETKMNQCISVGTVRSAFLSYAVLCAGFSVMFYLAACFFFQKRTR